MALNYVSRAGSILDLLLNTTATPTQKQRVIDAFALLAQPGATNAEIAGVFIKHLREAVLTQLNFKEGQAASAATLAANTAEFVESP